MEATDIPAHRTQVCRNCSHPNEFPFFFCEECGVPRARLGRWRVTLDLSLIIGAFLATYQWPEVVTWPWPLYALYALLLSQFAVSLVKGTWRMAGRLWVWLVILLGGLLFAFHFQHTEGAGVFILALTEWDSLLREYPLVFFPAVAALLALILVPGYFRWGRKYGWVTAYRLIVLSTLVASLAVLALFLGLHWVYHSGRFPDLAVHLEKFVTVTLPEHGRYVRFLAISTLRIFLFEIFVFSAVRGYALVRRTERARPRPTLEGESGFTKSLLQIAHFFQVVGHILENMVRYLLSTALVLLFDLLEVIVAFIREILIPTVSLLLCGLLLHQLALSTDAYITQSRLSTVLAMSVTLVAVLFLALVFLGCKTNHRPGRILEFYGQLLSWLLPNLLVFFLLCSFTLWAYGLGMSSLFPDEEPLPFRLGALTKTVAVFLVALVVLIFYRRRTLLFAHPGAPAAEAHGGPEPTTGDAAEEEKAPSLRERLRRRIAEARDSVARRVHFPDVARRALSSARGLRERLEGRPRIAEELAELNGRIRERERTVRALEENRDKIPAERFENLRQRQTAELEDLRATHAKLQREVDDQHAQSTVEKTRIEAELAELGADRAELDRLHEIGALSKVDHLRQSTEIKMKIESATLQLRACERVLAQLAPLASPPGET